MEGRYGAGSHADRGGYVREIKGRDRVGCGGRYSKGGLIRNLATMGQNTRREWTMVLDLDFSLEPRDCIGGDYVQVRRWDKTPG